MRPNMKPRPRGVLSAELLEEGLHNLLIPTARPVIRIMLLIASDVHQVKEPTRESNEVVLFVCVPEWGHSLAFAELGT